MRKTLVNFLVLCIFMIMVSCSQDHNPMSAKQSSEEFTNIAVEQAESNVGVINIPKVDPELQSYIASLPNINSLARVVSEDSALFYAEKYLEAGKDGKLEIKNDRNGDSKVEIKKNNLPDNITVVFTWAEDNVYEGQLYSPDYDGDVVLSEPAKINLAYKAADWYGVNIENIGLYLLNETNDSWEKIDSKIEDEKLEAYLPRFGVFKIFHTIGENTNMDFFVKDEDVFYTKKYIKQKKGGGLKLGNSRFGKSQIKFKKYDLPEDLNIEFQWSASGTVTGRFNNMLFGPHGTNFNNPVRVELSYRMADLSGIDECKLAIFYYNEETGIWEYVGGYVDVDKKIIIAFLKHFSRYGIAYSD